MLNFTNRNNIPTLPKQNNNAQKFYTYLVLNSEKGLPRLQWKNQPILQRNIQLYEQMHDEFRNLCSQQDRGNGVAQFWCQVVLNQQTSLSWEPANKKQLAWEHLASYFEEKCYWMAKNLCWDCNLDTWEEFLFLAKLLIYNPLKLREILVRYNPSKGNIDSYVYEALTNYVKSETTQNKFSHWRLLYCKSDKELREALQVFGRQEPEISQFIFARKYFKQVYLISKVKNPARKSGQKWLNPDAQDFEQSAQCYNAEKFSKSAPYEVLVNSTNVTGKLIQEWMQICIQALEQYPKSILPKFSLEALQLTGFEVKSESIALTELTRKCISDSEFSFQEKINPVLSDILITLKPDAQKLLFLYYGFELSQKQLASTLNMNQSTISRCLAKSTLSLLNKMLEISQPQKWIDNCVKSWLKQNYQVPIHSDIIHASLIDAVKKLSVEELNILRSYPNQQINQDDTKLHKIICHLQDELLLNVNIWMKKYIDNWLTNYYKSIVMVMPNGSENLDTQTIVYLVENYFRSS
ncbi:hypothetical protein NIES2101_28840 [Calothrix sp. HK-06]|nr:hypothetical protein NIES2101_28840 [Calothrix sp. HK-06]